MVANSILNRKIDPNAVARDIAEYRETARLLSSSQPRMVELYPMQWVAVYQGAVRAHGESRDEVLREIDSLQIPREKTLVRFIHSERRSLIL